MRTVSNYSPFRSLKPLNFDSLLDEFWGTSIGDFTGVNATSISPSVNIVETGEAFYIEVAAPGLQKEDFNVTVRDNRLTISAEKQSEETPTEDKKVARREFNYSSFSRSFALSEHIDQQAISAKYDSGILSLELKKIEKAQKLESKIEIQ